MNKVLEFIVKKKESYRAERVDLKNDYKTANKLGFNAETVRIERDISNVLWQVSTTNPNPQLTETYKFDASLNYYYTTDYMTTNKNICRELFQQMIKFNPDRFNDLVLDNNNLFSIPIINGDTISFQYTINPDPNQHTITNVPPFGGRVYTIKIVVDDGSHSNITTTD